MGVGRDFAIGPLPILVHDYGGQGPDVLLLHGGGRRHTDWDSADLIACLI
jgi:hypothetical protein